MRGLPIRCFSIREFLSNHISAEDESLLSIDWAENIYLTRNFVNTVTGTTKFSDYLRIVDVFIYFQQSREILLVSEREANYLLPLLWKKDTASREVHYYSLKFLSSSDVNDLGAETCASMRLYAGETEFNGEKMKDAVLKMILAKRLPAQNTFTSVLNKDDTSKILALRNLIVCRDKGILWCKSDLESICKEVEAIGGSTRENTSYRKRKRME